MTVKEAYSFVKDKYPNRTAEFAVKLKDRYVFNTIPKGYNYAKNGPFIGGLIFVKDEDGSIGEFIPPMFPEYKVALQKTLIAPEFFM